MALRGWTHDFLTARPGTPDGSTPGEAGDTSASADMDPRSPRWSWVPIRSLAPRHRTRIRAHLLKLSPDDRYLRFGYATTDAQIGRYVEALDFERDEVFGIFNRKLTLIAMAHVAYAPMPQRVGTTRMAEFGVSVLASARGRGYGSRLFAHAILHARNRGVDSLFIHALSENTAMLRIARKAGARIEREGSESQAWLALPEDSLSTRLGELFEERAAQWNYRFKRTAHRRRKQSELPQSEPPAALKARGTE